MANSISAVAVINQPPTARTDEEIVAVMEATLRQAELRALVQSYRDREAVDAAHWARLIPEEDVSAVRRWAAHWALRVCCADLELPAVRVQWVTKAYTTEVLGTPEAERSERFISHSGPFIGMAPRSTPDLVYVMDALTPEQTASTTVHELRHRWQFLNGFTDMDVMQADAKAYEQRWHHAFAAKDAMEGIVPKTERTEQAEPVRGPLTPLEFAALAVNVPDADQHPPEAIAAWKAVEDAIDATQQARRDHHALNAQLRAATDNRYEPPGPAAARRIQELETAVAEARALAEQREDEERAVRVASNAVHQRLSDEKMRRARAEMEATAAAELEAQLAPKTPVAKEPSALMNRLLGR